MDERTEIDPDPDLISVEGKAAPYAEARKEREAKLGKLQFLTAEQLAGFEDGQLLRLAQAFLDQSRDSEKHAHRCSVWQWLDRQGTFFVAYLLRQIAMALIETARAENPDAPDYKAEVEEIARRAEEEI